MDKIRRLPHFPGWHLIGAFPEDLEGNVGSWLLHDNGEAMLLEIPEEMPVAAVTQAVRDLNVQVRYVTASHEHWDHLDETVWDDLKPLLPDALFIHPTAVRGHRKLDVGGEPLWLIKAPKHSLCDVVTVFRGVAMTGDIETRTLDSVCGEVPLAQRRRSFQRLREFPERFGYRIHSAVSAHLTSADVGVDWPGLFTA